MGFTEATPVRALVERWVRHRLPILPVAGERGNDASPGGDTSYGRPLSQRQTALFCLRNNADLAVAEH